MSENCHNQLCRHVKMTLYSKYETRIFFKNVPGTVAFVIMNSCLWSPKVRQSKNSLKEDLLIFFLFFSAEQSRDGYLIEIDIVRKGYLKTLQDK